MKIIVSQEIESVCPTFVGACVEAHVENSPYCKELWDEINALGEKFKSSLTTESVSYTHLTLPTIVSGCRSRWSPYH